MIFAFGQHELDEERFELRFDGRRVDVQPKVLTLLAVLVRNHQRVVPKAELLREVWPDSAVTDGSLARAVSLARLAIGDRGQAPALIVTVPRRGYRFQAPVREAPASATGEPPASAGEEADDRYVGRRELRARLEALLLAALRRPGRILFLAGEAGIGKTRTAEILCQRARRAGATVATAWRMESGAATYAPWARILRVLESEFPGALSSLPPAARAALSPLLSPDPGPREVEPARLREDEAARIRLFEATEAFLTRCAEARPIAIFLDDLHEADAESLWLLEFLGRALGTLPIAIVATAREDGAPRRPQQARALERLLRLPALERWPLAGLQTDEVRDFVRLALGAEPDPALIGALERKTGGNPLLLGESLRSLEARGALGVERSSDAWEALLPLGIQHLLAPKLRALSPAAVEALGCAAAIGIELDRELLARCLPERGALEPLLRELEEAGLLVASNAATGGLRFPHALVRDALHAELAPQGERLRSLHERIAVALDERATAAGDALAERAHHACQAAPRIAPERAAALAQAAGEQAASLRDFEGAAAWYERALAALDLAASGADPAARAALHLGLGAAQTRTLGLDRARLTFGLAADLARAIGRGDLLAAAALGFAHRPNASGDGDAEVVAFLEEAAQALPDGDQPLRIRVLSRLAAELRYVDPARADALLDGALSAARRLGDPAVLAQTLDDCSFVRWSPADPEGWIALNAEIVRAARASGDLELELLGQKGRVTGFLELGDVRAVDREIRACEQLTGRLRTPYAHWLCTALRAMRALLDGDLEGADRHIVASIALGERLESPDVALELQAQIVYLRLEQGRAGEIETAARAQVQHFPDAPAWRAALARVLAAMGRLDEAGAELERLARQRFTDVPRDRGWMPTLALASEVAFATRNTQAAARLEELLAPYARLAAVAGSGLLFYGPVAHHLGLVAAARAGWSDAIACFESALAMEERTGARAWEARTRIACARALLGRGARSDRARGARLAGDALATARTLGLAEIEREAQSLETALWSGGRAGSGSTPAARERNGSGDVES